MASLLSPIQKHSIDAALDRLHDTFSFEIYVYVEKQEDVSTDPNYNALYGSSSSQNVASYSKIMTRHSVMARVKYFSDQEESLMANNLPESRGRIRIKILPDDYEKIKICTKVEIRGDFYIVDGDADIEGVFSDNYYTVYLRREN
jgi:hypothetical protein